MYEAYVREKEEAKQEYEQAVISGQAAAHVALRYAQHASKQHCIILLLTHGISSLIKFAVT